VLCTYESNAWNGVGCANADAAMVSIHDKARIFFFIEVGVFLALRYKGTNNWAFYSKVNEKYMKKGG
jgi:hypothetical protein